MRILLQYGRPFWPLMLMSLVAAAGAAFSTTYVADVLRQLVDEVLVVPAGVSAAEYYSSQIDNLYQVVALAVIVTVGKGVSIFTQQYAMSYVCHKMVLKLKVDFYDKLQKLPLKFFATRRTGDLVARVNGDILAIEMMLKQLINIIPDPLIVIGLISYMFYIYWQLALLVFLIIPVLGFVVRWLSKRLRRTGILLQQKVGDISALIQESVVGIKIIKAFRMEEVKLQAFEDECETNFRYSMKSVKYSSLNTPVVEFADSIGLAIMLYFGAKGVIDGLIKPGELIGFLTCLGIMFHPIKKITNANAIIQQAAGALDRILEIFEESAEINTGTLSVPKDLRAEISLRNVGFSYGDSKKVLNSINLDVKEGQALALVGHSGSGKTTLVSLLPRFYELSEGEIFIGGKEIREYKLDEYRHLFGIVPQEVVLFKGTVCDNVRFAKPDASKEEVEAACRAANAHDFILEMENGYDTELSEMGVGLSGGQRQRIAIARAILKDPRILILDEATSALDSQSEQVVQEALERLMKNRTTFVIAHRISTVMNSDRIVVLDQGRIEAMGTHEELLRNSRIYPELCKGLADKEEAA